MTLKKPPPSLMKKSLKMAHVRHKPFVLENRLGDSSLEKSDSNAGNIKNQPAFKGTELLNDDLHISDDDDSNAANL